MSFTRQIDESALERFGRKLGVDDFFDAQHEAFELAYLQSRLPVVKQRICLYFKTGAGKTITSLGCLWFSGHRAAVVITPPATFAQWKEWADKLGMEIDCMSHAMFRKKQTKLSRTVPIIVDEFHLLGGHTGQGWKKMDRLSMGLQAPLYILSATPNYNDAERCYCVAHVLDAEAHKGGYLEFIYRHCETQYNPFSTTPDVTGFKNHVDAADFLSSLPNVVYVPDDLQYAIDDVVLSKFLDTNLMEYGYDVTNHRIVASQIEEKHLQVFRNFAGLGDVLLPSVGYELLKYLHEKPLLMFAAHSTVAELVYDWLVEHRVNAALITGKTSTKEKAWLIAEFNSGDIEVLVGTASLATGTDGMDKVCNHLLILDDTDDPSLRRQLIGRIMPRGRSTTPVSQKRVSRLVFI